MIDKVLDWVESFTRKEQAVIWVAWFTFCIVMASMLDACGDALSR